MKRFLFASFGAWYALTLPALAELCDNPQTQGDMNYCAQYAYTKADADLNDVYGKFKKLIAKDSQAKAYLLKAQKAWIIFRDAECALEGSATQGGSAQPMIIINCKTRLTSERVQQFRARLNCTEGDLTCFNSTDAAD
jgi:uncharacterized protein YecT (DUF1311 family)